jgi:catechol 2,3-dioxygenase-like lactoylglutathione lyase family enzyme
LFPNRREEEPMPLLNDLHHMTFLTGDMDRLIGFYERVFDARVTFDRTEGDPPRRRHAFIEIGPQTVLHPFQVNGVDPPRGSRSSRAGASPASHSARQARKPSSRSATA